MRFRFIPQFEQNRDFIDLSTNSYLSLHIKQSIAQSALELTASRLHGNLSSRLVSEQSPLFLELEREIAQWKGTECALLFNSGYAANIGILQAICNRETEVFCDRLNHASIYDGILMSGCKLNRFGHRDMADLQKRLSSSKSKEKLIVTDTIFSMDGDRAPLDDICSLAEKFDCMVMIDEAHAAGVFGRGGSGLADEDGVSDKIDIRMGTLSKAVAGLGGFFAGDSMLRDYFVNSCRSLIYSTGLPHQILAFNLAAIRFIRSEEEPGRQLLISAESFRNSLHEIGISTPGSTTQIIPCITGTDNAAVALSMYLRENGIICPAIRPPTVPEGTARIRISINSAFNSQQKEYVLKHLSIWKKKNG